MTISRVGSLAAVLGGLVWIVAAVIGWGDDELDQPLYLAGLVLLVLAFVALGYALVSSAPVWLRVVVAVATPLLGLMVWLILRDSLSSEYVAVLAGGVLLLVGGAIALGRSGRAGRAGAQPPARRPDREPPKHGHRADR